MAVAVGGIGVADAAGSGSPLRAVLARLDERLARAVTAAAVAYGPTAIDDPHRGLYIGDDEVARLLARAPCVSPLGAGASELAAAAGPGSTLARLGASFELGRLDLDVVVVALAPELDLRYERLYAYLQDDVTRRRPSVDLALSLVCADADAKLAARSRLAADAPLRRHRLLELTEDPGQPDQPLLARALRLDPQVVRALLDERALDDRLAPVSRLVVEPHGRPAAPLTSELLARRPLRLHLLGRPGSGRRSAAAAIAAALDVPLLAVDGRALARADDRSLADLLLREARLQDALLFVADADALREPVEAPVLEQLLGGIASHDGPVVLSGSEPLSPAGTGGRRALGGLVTVAFPLPSAAERRAHWRARLADAGREVDERAVEDVASRFRLTRGQIDDAVAAGPADDLLAAARAQAGGSLGSLARKVEPRRRFADLVLPADRRAQLHELCDAIRCRDRVYDEWGFDGRLSLGKGLNALFAGPSGTGKTLAAEVLACELGLDLYVIDLSAVVSKYIGETEKNLARVFAEAEATGAILFFDEADALFGKRSEVHDAHDRYANIELGYLLQRLETYEGVVVLATNLRRNMDEAFVRRLQFAIEFPLPDVDERLSIWRGIWPAATPLDPAVDLEALARRHELAGGHIRNIAVAAAFLAAADGGVVTAAHLEHAARREHQKLGTVVAVGGPA